MSDKCDRQEIEAVHERTSEPCTNCGHPQNSYACMACCDGFSDLPSDEDPEDETAEGGSGGSPEVHPPTVTVTNRWSGCNFEVHLDAEDL